MTCPAPAKRARRRAGAALTAAALLMAVAPVAAHADQWFKTDTHVHTSAVSGDAPQDPGISAAASQAQGFNVLFATDHTAAGTQATGGVISNHLRFDEGTALVQWDQDNYPHLGSTPPERGAAPTTLSRTSAVAGDYSATLTGATLSSGNQLLCELSAPTRIAAASTVGPNSTINEMTSLPYNTGAESLHLASTNSGYGETFASLKRGPNLHSGDIILKFSVNPTRIDTGSGMYVSMSIGGDATISNRPPTGYTPQGGTPQIGKHTVLVWQLGNPREDLTNPDARVITHSLPYMLGQWNTYTINVTQALQEIPVADRPNDLDGLAMVKMAAAANGGTADGYFDTFSVDTQADMTQGQEFVYRNQRVHDYDTANFKIYPGQEMGYNRHVQRFNFGITDPSQFTAWKSGTFGAADAQSTGYPIQLDHPGLPGGVTQQEALTTAAANADSMETAERGETGLVKNVMVDTWDGILKQGVQLLGAWSSDAHRPEKFGPATYLLSPTIGFDDLMRSYFEGRSYTGLADFTGRAIFNVDGSATNPFPARYPVWVSPSQTLARVHFKIDGGITPGSHVIWTRNGDPVLTESVPGSSYDGTRSFSLSGPWTYVRAELRDAADTRIAMSQPIFFRDTAGALSPGMSFHVNGVTTPSGIGYTKGMTQGITASSWDATNKRLSMTVTNPSGSLVELRTNTGGLDGQSLTVDGTSVPAASSRAAFDSATGSSWWYDVPAHRMLMKARQTGATATVVAGFGPTSDTSAPSTPTGLTAVSLDATRIKLDWTASTGDVDGYTVYRDNVPVAITDPATTTYTDNEASGTHTYAVDAFDVAENHSARSASATATTDTKTVTNFNPVADAYVDSANPNLKNGLLTSIRVDGSPIQRSYLRFNVAGLTGAIQKVTLRIYANSASAGHAAHSADNNWAENLITYNNAPAPSGTVYGTTKGGAAGTWTTVDVTPLVTGNGTYTIAIDSANTTGVNLASRESANPPQLVVEDLTPSNDPPVADDLSLTTHEDQDATWTPAVTDAEHDAITCTLVSQPANGTATVASDCSGGTYSPNPGYTGADPFSYKATDSHGADSNAANVDVAVIPPNHAPTATDTSLTTAQGTAGSWMPLVADSDDDAMTCAIVSQPTNGSATVAPDCSGGTYTPAPGYSGSDTFVYRATDAHGADSNTAAVTATVTPTNSPPTASDRTLTTPKDAQGSWTPSVSDPDGDTLACSIAAAPTHGTATVSYDCTSGTYTPDPGYTGGDSFTYRATDSHGMNSNAATVSATVTAPNQSPTAADRTVTTTQDVTGSWTPGASDPDGDPVTCSIVTPPSHGSAGVASDCSSGSYTPAAGYSGSDSFTYKVTDSHSADSSPGTVSATVGPANHVPSASDRSLTTTQNVTGSWTPSVSDTDGDPVTCSIVSPPAHGSASVASDCSSGSYAPAAGYTGGDSFTYRATDSHGAQSGPATVSATVVFPTLFSDGFESGTLAAWTSSKGLTIQSATVRNGSFAARGNTTTGVTYAKKTFSSTYNDVTYRVNFRYDGSAPAGSPTIMRFRTGADKALVGLYLTSTKKLGLRNDVTAVSKSSTKTLEPGLWYALELHAVVNGTTASAIDVSVDGTKLTDVSTTTANLGTIPIGMVQLGENIAALTYNFTFDDVLALRTGSGTGSTLALRAAAPSCTSRSSVRLSAPRRQRVVKGRAVRMSARSAKPCRVVAFASTWSRKRRHPVRSRSVRITLNGRTRSVKLPFPASALRRIRKDLAGQRVYVLVYANGTAKGKPLATRRVLVAR